MSRGDKIPLGWVGWLEDDMDVSSYLVFLPGRTIGKRLNGFPDSNPDAVEIAKLGERAEVETDPVKHTALYRELDHGIADVGPSILMYQPVLSYAFRSNIEDVIYTTGWYVEHSMIGKG